MTRRPARLVAVASVAMALLATACTSDDEPAEDPGGAPDQVTYHTAFGTFGRDAFAWVAEQNGYFAEAGLDVEIVPGAGTGPNLDALAAGDADFVSLDMTGATIEAGKGTHTDFRIIAAVHQRTLVSIISLEGYEVTSPQDLEGKQIGAAANSVNQLLFPAYAAVAGIDEGQVEWVNVEPAQLTRLLASGGADALSTFLIGQRGVEIAADGTPAVVLPYSEYLTDLYGNALIASNTMIEQDPDLVARFRDAMLKALEWTVAHPDEAAQIITDANPESAGVEAAKAEIESMTPSVLSAGTVGVIDEVRLSRSITLLQGAGLIPPGLRPEELVAFQLTPAA